MVSLVRARSGVAIGRLDKLESVAESVLDKILGAGMSVAAVLLVIWPFVFTLTVAKRHLFHDAAAYLEEYTGYWVLIITCLALAYTLRRGAHIRTDIAVNYLPRIPRNIMEIFVTFIALITSSIFTAHGIRLVLFAIKQDLHCIYGSSTLLWPVYLWIPVGYGLLSLALFLYFCRTILVVLGKRD